jgi:hypothetical protein
MRLMIFSLVHEAFREAAISHALERVERAISNYNSDFCPNQKLFPRTSRIITSPANRKD